MDQDVTLQLAAKTPVSPKGHSPTGLSVLPPQLMRLNLATQSEESDDDSDSVNDVAAHLSREETPDNDALPQDEPSSILASKIMRAHDNPSPPPPNRAHPGTSYVPGKSGHFPLLDISFPGSLSFRDTNLVERLTRGRSPGYSCSLSPTPGNKELESNDSANVSRQDLISFDSCSTPNAPLPVDQPSDHDSAIADSPHILPSVHLTVDDLLSASPEQLSPTVAHMDGAEQGTSLLEKARKTNEQEEGVGHEPSEVRLARSSSPSTIISLAPSSVALSNSPFRVPRRSPRKHGIRDSLTSRATTTLGSSSSEENTGVVAMCAGNGDAVIQDGTDGARSSPSVGSNEFSTAREQRNDDRRITTGEESKDGSTPQRKLGSLSPQSADVLTRLLTLSQPRTILEQLPPYKRLPSTSPRPDTAPCVQTSVTSDHHTSEETTGAPTVVPIPRRPNGVAPNPPSPLKFSLTVEDVARTPARRVLTQNLFSEGAFSQQASHSGALSDLSERFAKNCAPFSVRPALDDPSRSPAKRVPLTSSTSYTTRLGSPSRARSASVEPKPLKPTLARSHSVEPSPTVSRLVSGEKAKDPAFPRVPVFPSFGAKLPFALPSGQKSRSDLPDTIQEEHGSTFTESPDKGYGISVQSPVKSQLRQPSTGSRIPRIGAKPYARSLPKDGKTSAKTVLKRAASNTPKMSSSILVRTGYESGNSNLGQPSVRPDNNQESVHNSVVATLKRKRDLETVISPEQSRPIPVRQVASGGLHSDLPGQGVQASADGSSQKAPGLLKFRKVVDGMLSARYTSTQAGTSEGPAPGSRAPSHPSGRSTVGTEEAAGKPTLSSLESIADKDAIDASSPPPVYVDPIDASFDSSGIPSLQGNPESSGHLRRTSRRRKTTQHDADISGSSTRPSARRKPQTRADAEGFMGMSATELKALTTSNTARNQQTVSTFATEVVRREGHRPDSPMTKARTILQKQREERDNRRKERAERRARRSRDGPGSSDTEPSGQSKFGLDIEHDENQHASRNHRGPGDEEDFGNPERSEHPSKRMRYDEGTRDVKPTKQVKWHRGLSTIACLDDLHPKPRNRSKDIVIEKGCLAPAAKNLRLDTHGNIVDIDNRPFPELVREYIVIKKFLYDDDVEPEPVPRSTRSKSRRTKS